MPAVDQCPLLHALQITLQGRVQGLGVRPAVVRWATELDLSGTISNTNRGVEIVVEGREGALDAFVSGLRQHLPPAAYVEHLQTEPSVPQGLKSFSIRAGKASDAFTARVPPDRVVCSTCLAEVGNPTDRRAGYAFTSCTDCGPRYSIIEAMPYERAQTSMATFSLCPACEREYQSPSDRRFHAQTTACAACGPRLWCVDRDGSRIDDSHGAIQAAIGAIQRGEIVAVRGLGGYQLVVDATSQFAVQRLRQRKRRHGKPLAVMVGSLEEAQRRAWLDAREQELLTSRAGPIVVARAHDESVLGDAVRPGLDTVGLMLPTTPLHGLLLRGCRRPLIVTSGNAEGEPLAYRAEQATRQLRDVADVFLEHDRPIERPVDDSVVRVIAGRAAMIRLARGYAPLPLALDSSPSAIALGGHQKVAFALANGAQAVLEPHIGDMDTLASRERLLEQIDALSGLFGTPSPRFAVDDHPDYFTSRWAADQAGAIESVQHHHAHVVAGMVEHGWLDREVLGVAFDGTGYGADGTIWGGEFLRATATAFARVAHLRPFRLPGGERAVREPWRVAVSLVEQAAGAEAASLLQFNDEGTAATSSAGLVKLIRSERFSPMTTSCGRLFDGVAALALGISHCQFEGQTAMMLEAACAGDELGKYPLVFSDGQPRQLDWRPMVLALLKDLAAGVAPGVMAMRFHRGLACAVAELCRGHRPLPIVLGGGVFQNRVLVEILVEELDGAGQPLGLPGLIPVNDGGLAAGQLAVAAARRAGTLRA